MNVYQLHGDSENYQTLNVVHKEDGPFLLEYFTYRTLPPSAWRPLQIRVWTDEGSGYDGRMAPPSDYPQIGVMPVFSRRAVEELDDILKDNGTLLPLLFEGEEGHYFAYDLTHVADSLDEAQSEVERFADGRVMHVVHYEFHPGKVVGETIFKIPQQRGRIYVTDSFVRRVNEGGLMGFSFKELWSDQREKPAHKVA
jgi:hypothetical protein